jgi:predicted PurR-regulated permease PerM
MARETLAIQPHSWQDSSAHRDGEVRIADMSEAAAWRVLGRGIMLVAAIVLLVSLVRELQSVIVQFLLALLLAAAATPIVDALTSRERVRGWRPGRGLAATVVFFGAVLLLILGGAAIAATVAPDLDGLAQSLPGYVRALEAAIGDLAARNPELSTGLQGALPSLQDLLGAVVGIAQASRLVSVATSVFTGVLYVLFSLVLALYLTIDGDRVRRYMTQFLPFERHEQALVVSERIGARLGAWARGEALLGAIIGGLTWVGAVLLGLPYAGALALIAAVGELIPNLGPIIAAIPLVLAGLLISPTHAVLALLLAILIQQLENNLIVPRVMSHAVDLHPVAVMLAILSGAELLGIAGALLAVPVLASLSVILDEVQRERLARQGATIALGDERLPDGRAINSEARADVQSDQE